MSRHFIEETDLTPTQFREILANAIALKKSWQSGATRDSLHNKTLAMIFEKASTRTRTSFAAGMAQLGGHALDLSPANSQMGRGEPVTDTSLVLSEMVNAVMLRTHSHQKIIDFAHVSRVPVINGLSDYLHPCQLLADMQTFMELRGDIKGARVAWIGPGNNMCNSYIKTADLLGFTLAISCPDDVLPDAQLLASCSANVELSGSPEEACRQANLITTDVWASMGEETDGERLADSLRPYQVDQARLQLAASDAVFMHCLPAHRGEEVTADVIDGDQSVVWQQAGNRLHAQKSLLEFLIL